MGLTENIALGTGLALTAGAAMLALKMRSMGSMAQRRQRAADEKNRSQPPAQLTNLGTVRNLTILPLIDYYADGPHLHTEPGVSYLIRADDTTILADVGFNCKHQHPSPLLQNMNSLKVSPNEVDLIFFSHLHFDHLGGFSEMKSKSFSLSQGPVDISRAKVFAPEPLHASQFNHPQSITVVEKPQVIRPGICSLGPITRHLFVAGETLEHTLAINVEGKGVVLVIGCGHPSIERILERCQQVLPNLPIYGIVGGLHYPVHGGRLYKGPINVQWLVACERPPWNGLNENDVTEAIAVLGKVNPKLVALSPHDSSDWSLGKFKEAFPDAYREIKVGKPIVV